MHMSNRILLDSRKITCHRGIAICHRELYPFWTQSDIRTDKGSTKKLPAPHVIDIVNRNGWRSQGVSQALFDDVTCQFPNLF